MSEEATKAILDRSEAPDVTVTCGPLTLPLHSFLLAADSKFFATMLDAPMVEKERKEISIKDVDPDIFEKVILFIYTKFDRNRTFNFDVVQQLEGMLDAAERFDMEELKTEVRDVVEEFISEKRDFNTRGFLVKTGSLAEMYNAEELLDLAASVIVYHGNKLEKREVANSPGLAVAVMAKFKIKMENKVKEVLVKHRNDLGNKYEEYDKLIDVIEERDEEIVGLRMMVGTAHFLQESLDEEINQVHQTQENEVEKGEEEVAKLKEELVFMAFEAWRFYNPKF